MWAKVLSAPYSFETVNIAEPVESDVPEGHVLLRFLAAGMCGSDGPFYRGDPDPWGTGKGAIPGGPVHEIVGEVVFSRSPHHRVGDRVVGWASQCDGLQEYVISNGEGLYKYNSSLDPKQAMLLQPLACVIYACELLGDVREQHCAVLGQGPIGVLFSHVLKNAGAGKVTGVDRIDRRDIAAKFGVDDPQFLSSGAWAAKLGVASSNTRNGWLGDDRNSERPQVIVEAIGHQTSTLNHAIQAVRPRGQIYYFGIPDDNYYPINMDWMLRKHLTLRSGVTLDRRRVLALADAYLGKHPELAGDYVTHTFPANEAAEAFMTAFTPDIGQLKVVITA
ncbi:alcohol dehydrogenase [Arthrobacter sp. StoSoilB22]|nr:alcohol dehydrogenase [Arthrobacter sp. StoSoilB22]